MLLQIDNITLRPDQEESALADFVKKRFTEPLKFIRILKKSLDARKKSAICFRYRVLIEADDENASELLKEKDVTEYIIPQSVPRTQVKKNEKIIVIGAGPAGLFASLRLIEAGAEVIILERGKKVEERMKDISILESQGILDSESNVLFGEGGAGTYSDGKLTTRINRPEILWFYDKLIENGAPSSIAYESKPHIGTDRLQNIMKSIRKTITDSGSQIIFGDKVTDLIIAKGKIQGLRTSGGSEITADRIILAAGHSARDVYMLLKDRGVQIEKKGFAIGSRIEHPAEEIRKIQYGNSGYRDILPAAEYSVTSKNTKTGRGTYSFCMCPGGTVINSSSEENLLCTNGMSTSSRKGSFSNSAIVVTVHPDDTGPDPLSGIELQREIEKKAFIHGGGGCTAPGQTIGSFIKDRTDKNLPDTSYSRGITPSRLTDFLPPFITDEIRASLHRFNERMRGFISPRATFIGAETRTSSPVRITRGEDFQSVNTAGLYPAGEGAGYAGGIVSSAVDGIRCADAVINELSTT